MTILAGALAVILGLLLIAIPGIAVASFVLLFAAYLILYGIVRIFDSLKAPQGSNYRLSWLVFGVIAILGGIGLLLYPGISLILLAYYIAFYAIIVGVLELIAGFGTKESVGKEILIIIAGFLSVLFGIYLFIYPLIGTALLILFYGWYSLIYGIILIVYGFTRKSANSNY